MNAPEVTPSVKPPHSARPIKIEADPASAPAKAPHRAKWAWLLVLGLVVAIGCYFLLRTKSGASAAGERGQNRATPVASLAAELGDLPVYLNALGTVTPLNMVTVRSRADGQLDKILFTEGQTVQAGDLLAQIDPRSYEVALDQAVGQMARDSALLENARRDLDRYQNAQAAVTQQQIDTAKATVAEYEGAVRADQASVNNFKLQLSYCRITAPISGVTGLRLVDQGNLVHASDATGIVVITQEQPITVVFSIPEENLPQLRRAMAGTEKLRVEAYDRSMQHQLAVGELAALDNQIDTTTGTVRIKALFPNANHALFPNQFVNVRLLVETQRGVTLIPNSAIQINSQSRYVFVVKPDESVERRTVKIAKTEAGKSAISEGLAVGEVVVTEGLDRLQDGAKVTTRTPVARSGAAAAPGAGHAGAGKRARPSGSERAP